MYTPVIHPGRLVHPMYTRLYTQGGIYTLLYTRLYTQGGIPTYMPPPTTHFTVGLGLAQEASLRL